MELRACTLERVGEGQQVGHDVWDHFLTYVLVDFSILSLAIDD